MLAQAIMEADVTELTAVPNGERDPERRLTSRNGYRERRWDTGVGTHDIDVDPPVREPVCAMITVDEVSLGTSPIQADGSYDVIRGRAVCVARDDLAGGISKRPFGPTRTIHVVP